MTASLALMLPNQITSFDVHERLFGIWQRVAPRLLPTHASQTEPVRTPFDPTNLPRDPYLWGGYSWLAVRKKPGVEAHFLDGLHHQSSIHIEVTLAVGAGPDLVRDLGLALAAELQPDFGLVHTLTRAEADEARPVRRPDVLTITDLGCVAPWFDETTGLTEPNVRSSAQIGQLVSDIKARAGRPLVVATGEESGRVSTFRDLFGRTPSARALAARPAPAVQQMASEIGSKLAAIGVNLDLAPVVDLDAGPAGGLIGDRSFSADPARAATYGLAWARGLAAAGVAPTAKHFPGHGRATQDSHLALPRVDTSLAELRDSDLKPFAELIKAGVPAIMLDHVAYTALDPALPASLAPKAYELLREMGFTGVAITDSVGMGAVNLRWGFGEAAVRAVTAGADAVLTTDGTQAPVMRDALVSAVRSGALPEARLNEAAGRVVALAGGDAKGLTCTSPRLPELG